MIRFVAVIDLGKTNSKVSLVDTRTAEEVSVVKQTAAVNTETVYPSLDHRAIETFLIDTLSSMSAQYDVDAITVTTHGAAAALIDSSGELALPVLDYEFLGVDEIRSDYEHYRPPFSETGSPALPGGLNIGAQLYWQSINYAAGFASVKSVLTWPQYWVYKFGGQPHNDVTSLGCHTDLYDPRQKRYSSLIDTMGWHSIMPPTVHAGKMSGTLNPVIAKKIGLSSTIPVFSGIHDSNASLASHLVMKSSPFSVVSTGTWFVVMAMGGSPTELDEKRDSLLNVNAMGQCVPSARFMGGRERELLRVSDNVDESALDTLLSNENSPIMLMPSVVVGTGPYPNSTMQWLNHEDCKPEHHNCAVSLYLALMTFECMQQIGCEGPTYIEGPLAQDSSYTQMLAAVSQRPLLISRSETGTSVGAAMLIAPPESPPQYISIDPEPARREKLERYAMQWQKCLIAHSK